MFKELRLTKFLKIKGIYNVSSIGTVIIGSGFFFKGNFGGKNYNDQKKQKFTKVSQSIFELQNKFILKIDK